MNDAPKTVILGIGSDYGDDALGLVVASQLAALLPQCVVRGLRSPLSLCDYVAGAPALHVVDACRGAGSPGSIFCCDWQSPDLENLRFSGTHDLHLVAALKLAEQLVGLPPRVTIWSIEAADEEHGTFPGLEFRLSPLVAAATEGLIGQIVAEVVRSEETAASSG